MAALDYPQQTTVAVGLALPGIQPQDRSLLLNSACELRLYQRRPLEARALAEEQIRVLDQPRAHVNFSLCCELSMILMERWSISNGLWSNGSQPVLWMIPLCCEPLDVVVLRV